jgi:hypothetical protein
MKYFSFIVFICSSVYIGFSQNIFKTKTELIYSLQTDATSPILYQKKVSKYDSVGKLTLKTEYSYYNDFINPPKESLAKKTWFFYDKNHVDSIVELEYYNGEIFRDYIYCLEYDSAGNIKRELKTNFDNQIYRLTSYSYIDSSKDIKITLIKDSLTKLHTFTKVKKADFFNTDSFIFKSIETSSQFGRITTTLYKRYKDSLVKEIHQYRPDIKRSVYQTITEKFTTINGVEKIVSSIELKREPAIHPSHSSSFQELLEYDAVGNLIETKYLIQGKVFQLSKFEYNFW